MSRSLDELLADAKQELREWANDNPDATDSDASDQFHEIADSSVPVYHSQLLALANEDNSLATAEPETGPAFDGKPTPVNIIAANVYERITAELAEEWRDIEEEREEFAEEKDNAIDELTTGNPESYAYNAALYCGDCGADIIRDKIDTAKTPEELAHLREARDTDTMPQPVFSDESDSPEHCDSCGEFLRNSLTSDGMNYVRELIARNPESDNSKLYREFYGIAEPEPDDSEPEQSSSAPAN